MKKFIALLLVCLMVVPFGMLATTSISAAAVTVYVSDNGDDAKAGTDAEPVKTLAKAFEKVGNEGTIIIKDIVTQSGNITFPAYTGTVTVKGATAESKLKATGRLILGGNTVFDSLTMENGSGTVVVACFYNFTATSTVTANSHAYLTNVQDKVAYTAKDNTITLEGGKWSDVILGGRNSLNPVAGTVPTGDDFDGVDTVLTIDKNADVNRVFTTARSIGASIKDGVTMKNSTATVNLLGGRVNYFVCESDHKTLLFAREKGITVNIGKNFDITASFTATDKAPDATTHFGADNLFYGVNGENVWSDDTLTNVAAVGKSKVVIAAEKYDSLKDSTLFRDVTVEKAGGTTPPPVPTGDIAWAYAVVASVALIGYAVAVSKKRA